MKLPNHLISAGMILLTLGLAGCQTHSTVLPLRNGYEEVSHPYHTLVDEPPPPRVSFQHRNADGTVTQIWPSLYGVPEVIKEDLAIFVGDQEYSGQDRGAHPVLFAVRSPEPPLDITDEVLWRWSKANGKNVSESVDRISLITPTEKASGLELSLEFWTRNEWTGRDNWPQKSSFLLDWQQVSEILHAVKAKGVTKKDLRWHTQYIGEQNN